MRHANQMQAGLVVLVLRGPPEHLERAKARVNDLLAGDADLGREDPVSVVERKLGVDSRLHYAGPHGLGDVVQGTEPEALDLIDAVDQRGTENDWNLRGYSGRP